MTVAKKNCPMRGGLRSNKPSRRPFNEGNVQPHSMRRNTSRSVSGTNEHPEPDEHPELVAHHYSAFVKYGEPALRLRYPKKNVQNLNNYAG